MCADAAGLEKKCLFSFDELLYIVLEISYLVPTENAH